MFVEYPMAVGLFYVLRLKEVSLLLSPRPSKWLSSFMLWIKADSWIDSSFDYSGFLKAWDVFETVAMRL